MSGLTATAFLVGAAFFVGVAAFAGTAFFAAFAGCVRFATVCAVGTLSIKMAALSSMGASVMNT